MVTKNRPANRLNKETSPYLQQHARNPVDWYPWCREALEKARMLNRPIFLSIGYSACHWCHVMERECFENESIARILNDKFVSIKVDREERPDIDETYMTAVQIMTGGGGWPLSVFLTPDLRPFYGGTYFPPESRFGRAGFRELLLRLSEVWEKNQDKIVQNSAIIADAVARLEQEEDEGRKGPDESVLKAGRDALAQAYDRNHGGFGTAPKFPDAMSLQYLLRWSVRSRDRVARDMVTATLDHMARGGIYDHIGGGFHRYATDQHWRVPHFEKMLYDSALLTQVYLEAWQLTGIPHYLRVVEDTLRFVEREFTDAGGAFFSSLDADTEGKEGITYLWTRQQILDVLGTEEGTLFCRAYGVNEQGNFRSMERYHEGLNVLHIPSELHGWVEENRSTLRRMQERLLAERTARAQPDKDDKIITSWNALMISALARAAQALNRSDYAASAAKAGQFILDHMQDGTTLLRIYRGKTGRQAAFLDDHAYLAVAFLDLYDATLDSKWLAAAEDLTRRMIDRFWDDHHGGFFATAAYHQQVLVRSKPGTDASLPSGNALAATALLRLGTLLGNQGYQQCAAQVLERHWQMMQNNPRMAMTMLLTADQFLHPAVEIAIVGEADRQETRVLVRTVHRRYMPAKSLVLLEPGHERERSLTASLPQLKDKTPVDGMPAAYVCVQNSCQPPVTSAAALERLLDDAGIPSPPAQEGER